MDQELEVAIFRVEARIIGIEEELAKVDKIGTRDILLHTKAINQSVLAELKQRKLIYEKSQERKIRYN